MNETSAMTAAAPEPRAGIAPVRVFAFRPLWGGLPTSGPFAIKLMAWLALAGVPYEHVVEDNPGKGPKGKSPWIERTGVRAGETLADSDLIIDTLAAETGFDIDARLTALQRAEAHVWQRAFEEHFHQVLEWELMVHPAGVKTVDALARQMAPAPLAPLLSWYLRRSFRRQLAARGIARHDPATIAAKGRADINALAEKLRAAPFIGGEAPCRADLAVFGQVAPLVRWDIDAPVGNHAKAQAAVVDFVTRLEKMCFGKA
jgi:glutathione S-transferase